MTQLAPPSLKTKDGARISLAALEKRVGDLERMVGWPALAASWRRDLDAHKTAMAAKGWL
jgi:hypothetical protein